MSVVVAAYNEAATIGRKIETVLAAGARTPDLLGPDGGTPITTSEMGDAIVAALDASL